jgi:sulfatase maturation enzyme AslB (radical SAM superfamily)
MSRVLNAPSMEITTNVGCSVNCLYCPQESFKAAYFKKSEIKMMSLETFKTCIDKLPGEVYLDFSGMSEPWLNYECAKMLLYAQQKKRRLRMFTTLVGMRPQDLDILGAVNFEVFCIHLPSADGLERINVDARYLSVLERVIKTNNKLVFLFFGNSVHPLVKPIIKKQANHIIINSRAGNLKSKKTYNFHMNKGTIKCSRGLHYNILLPNGDVLLCCMDYNMQHILGNLLVSNYNSLFFGEEFLQVSRGLEDESLDILCRRCDGLGYHVNIWRDACYRLPVRLYYLRNVRTLRELFEIPKNIRKKIRFYL